jgi:predicted dehydrogenase
MIDSKLPRRKFIKISGATAAAVSVLPKVFAKDDSSKTLNIGIIGLGGRGSGAILNAIRADEKVKLTAVCEVFRDRLDTGLANVVKNAKREGKESQIAVDEKNKFTGFEGYKHLLASDIDIVILTTPPHFRPQHAEAAVKAGKHVFAEKPLATDAVGLRRILKAIKEAKQKNLSFLVGFCYRFHNGIKSTIEQIQQGAIGDIMNIQASYNSGGVWHRGNNEKWSQMEYQMRNWYYFNWLCGDHIVEQCVHNMDKVTWVMGDKPPLSCLGFGGRQQRTAEKYGNIYDHFSIAYEYDNNIFANVNCRHQTGTDSGVSDLIRGTKGQADLMNRRIIGENKWRYNSKKRDPSMYDAEHKVFFEHIRNNKAFNNGEVSVISTGLALMGRMSAYTGRRVYWDYPKKPSLMTSQEDLTPSNYDWADIAMRPVPIPGRTKFV